MRVLQKKPTILRLDENQLIGFADDGLRIHSLNLPTRDPTWDYPRGTWALVDPAYTVAGSSGEPTGPLLTKVHLFVVFTTSLRSTQDIDWAKKTKSPMIVMNPTWEDEMQAYRCVAFCTMPLWNINLLDA
jgi:hypothetical protein